MAAAVLLIPLTFLATGTSLSGLSPKVPCKQAAAYHQARIVAILVAVIMLIPPLLVGIGVLGGRCTLGTRLMGVSHCEKWEPTFVRDFALDRAAQDVG